MAHIPRERALRLITHSPFTTSSNESVTHRRTHRTQRTQPRAEHDLASLKGSLDGTQRAIDDVSAAVTRVTAQLLAVTSALEASDEGSKHKAATAELTQTAHALEVVQEQLRNHAPDALASAEFTLNKAETLLHTVASSKNRSVANAARSARSVLEDAQTLNRTATTALTALVTQAQGAAAKASAYRQTLGRTTEGRKVLAALDELSSSRQTLSSAFESADPFAVGNALEAEAKGISSLSRAAWQRFSPDLVGFLKTRGVLFDVPEQIATLKPGERYMIDLAADVHRGAGVNAISRVEIAHNDDGTFTIGAQGQVGVNLTHELKSPFATNTASGAVSWQGLVGGGVTLTCTDATEARRVVALLKKVASKEGTIKQLTSSERSFLSKQLTGLELSATAAAQVVGALRLQTRLALVQVAGRARGAVTPVVHLDLDSGRLTGLHVRETLTATARGTGFLTPGGPRLSSIMQDTQRLSDMETTLSLDTWVSLPPDFTLESVATHPASLRGAKLEHARLEARSLLTAGNKFGGPASEVRASFSLDPTHAPPKALLNALMASDFTTAKAEAQRAGALAMNGTFTNYTQQRLGVRNVTGRGVIGFEATFEARRLGDPQVVARW